MDRPIPLIKGRGASTQVLHRYRRDARERVDDGWDTQPAVEELIGEEDDPWSTSVATEVRADHARSVITANDSPDISFDYAINPYRGCEHGCSYCYARPSHSYLDLSPGLDFETVILAKHNLAEVLRAELSQPRYVPRPLVIGSVTDAYQPVERRLRLTRAAIEVLQAAKHPFSLITKSSGVERDLDLIAPMAAQGLAAVYVTITTLDATLARRMEPRAASPQRRLRTIRTLHEAGVPVGVSVAPQIPFLNDDMEQVLEAAQQAGATRAFYTVLRLPWELKDVFTQWLQLHYPQRAERVMARIREMRGGRDYQSDFSQRMHGQGVWAQLLRQRFAKACARLGLNQQRTELDLSQFNPDALRGQGRLF
jgi:DNA repair photolyase